MRKIELDEDAVVAMYESGMGAKEIGLTLGVSEAPIIRVLRTRRVAMRDSIKIRDEPEVVRMHFAEGISVKQIAIRLGLGRDAVVGAIRRAGAEQRGRSAAMFVRMAAATPEERARLASAAHVASKGKPRTDIAKARRAATMMRLAKSTELESVFVAALRLAGFDVVPQLAEGPYSIDIAIPSRRVAVEIDPGHWHDRKSDVDNLRDEYLRGAGWDVVRWSGNQIRRSNPLLSDFARTMVAKLTQRLCG